MKRVKRCPECRSADIFYDTGYETGQKYKCKNCGYLGALIIEEDYDDKDGERG